MRGIMSSGSQDSLRCWEIRVGVDSRSFSRIEFNHSDNQPETTNQKGMGWNRSQARVFFHKHTFSTRKSVQNAVDEKTRHRLRA